MMRIFFDMFQTLHSGIHHNGRLGDWYPDVPMSAGLTQPIMVLESLAAFYPGMQTLLGELNPAARSTNAFTMARESVKFLPERFDISRFEAFKYHQTYQLRPELYESNYFLHSAVKDLGLGNTTSGWLWSADFFLHALEDTARTGCGYGIVKGVSSSPNAELSVTDEMPSFFLSETLKYLYLTFDENNPINSDKERNWIFTTEAHPVFTPHSSKTGNIGSQDEKWLDDARSNLLKSVDNLIASNNTASLAMRVPAKNKGRQNNTNRRLHRETWALKTGKFPHMKDLQNLSSMRSLKDTANRQKPLSSWRRGAIGRILDHTLSLTGLMQMKQLFIILLF